MKPTFVRMRNVGAVAAVLALTLTSCAGAETGTSNTDDKQGFELTASTPAPVGEIDHFSWALKAEPYSLSPLYAFDYPDNTVTSNLCESLFRWNADLTTSPGLAESFENPDPLTWVYKIREGVKFHDGSDLTAEDVVASLNAHLDPELASFWQSSFSTIDSIEQTGEFEVTVKTTTPDPGFNMIMAAAPGAISSAESLKELGREYGNATTGVNCTGPFKFDSWQSGEKIELSRFDDYWDDENKANAETMTFSIMSDSNAVASAMQTGEIDGGWQLPGNALATLQQSEAGEVYFGTNSTVQSLIVADTEGPLGDPLVRQALSMAINREALIEATSRGKAEPGVSLTPESVWAGADDETLERISGSNPNTEYDVDRAKELIIEAGAEGAELTIASTTYDPNLIVIAQAVASAGAEIGLNITIDDRPANAYTMLFSDPSAREGVDLFITSWFLSTTDPLEMYAVLRTGEFSNYGGYSNPEFDKLTNEALEEGDIEKRMALAADVQEIADADLPWIPLIEPPTTVWLGERITGVDPSINFLYYPWAAKIGSAG